MKNIGVFVYLLILSGAAFLGCSNDTTDEAVRSRSSAAPAWYVDSGSGLDTHKGDSPDTAFATLTRAMAAARSSSVHTINILASPVPAMELSARNRGSRSYKVVEADAVYDFSSLLTSFPRGTLAPEITIRGAPPKTALPAAPVVLSGDPGKRILNIGAGENLRFENIRLTGGDCATDGGAVLLVNGGSLVIGVGTVVSGNRASRGSGLYVQEGNLVLDGGEFSPEDDIYLAADQSVTLGPRSSKGTVQATVTLNDTTGRFVFIAADGSPQTLDNVVQMFNIRYVAADGELRTSFTTGRGWFAADTNVPEPDSYFVSSTGDDTARGYTEAAPLRTMEAAFNAIRAGSPLRVITVLGTPGDSGSDGSRFLASDLGAAEVTIRGVSRDGVIPALSGASGLRVLTVASKTTLRLENILLTSGDAPRGAGLYVEKDAAVFLNGVMIGGNRGDLGSGIYNEGAVVFEGATKVYSPNTVHLESGRTITVSGILTAEGTAATIESAPSDKTRQVLDGSAADLAANNARFTIAVSDQWSAAGVPGLCPDSRGYVITGADFYVWKKGDDSSDRVVENRRIYRSIAAALAAARGAAADGKSKTIMVIGTLDSESEKAFAEGDEGSRVFVIPPSPLSSPEPLLTITGWLSREDPPILSARGSGKGVVLVEGKNTKIAFSNIGILGGTAPLGGGLFVRDAEVTLDDGAILKENHASVSGGGIHGDNAVITNAGGTVGGANGGNSAPLGGGVSVVSSVLYISGGAVIGNRGGGVYADSGTVFQSGGAVADNGGIGIRVKNSEYSLSGGTVAGNAAAVGAAVYVESTEGAAAGNAVEATFSMKGGEISRHAATAVYISRRSAFVMSGGSIFRNGNSASRGGAVALSGAKMTITGGDIRDNEAAEGGAVYLDGYTGDTKIPSFLDIKGGNLKANKALRGGGVYVNAGAFSHTGGVINGNQAADGGGVYAAAELRQGLVSGGAIISGNTAGRGGGVFLAQGGNFSKTAGGTIFGGTPEDIGAWADLTNNAGDGSSHAVFVAAPALAIAKTVSNAEDM